MKDKLKKIFTLDYRHYICTTITVGLMVMGVLFPNAIPRIGEALRDLGTSFVYYFYGLFVDNPEACPVQPSVMSFQSWQFADSPWKPLSLFPWTWEEFQVLWGDYWRLWINVDNIKAYFTSFLNCLQIFAKVLAVGSLLIVPLWIKARSYTEPKDEEAENEPQGGKARRKKRKKKVRAADEDSLPLQIFKKLSFRFAYPLGRWFKAFFAFIKENKKYYQIWLFLGALYFNVISIVVAFLAFYLYFIVSFDFLGIYTQVVKLISDLTPVLRFVPVFLWVALGFLLLNHISRESGFSKLEHLERRNRGFLNELGVVTVIYGNMGTGKTRMLTSLALSAEKQLRDQALEVLLETDMQFPNFPWAKFRAEIKQRMDDRRIVDVFSIRRWIRRLHRYFNYLESKNMMTWYRRRLRKKGLSDVISFGYDIEHYKTTYNDNLTVKHFYQALEDYAQAYLVYSVQSSLIFSNYSIRVDFECSDNGHFPLYNDDFFRRNPKYQDMYSRYCHIIDFDMLRLGKRMLEENPNRNALGFGVYVVSEIDKERKNELQIRKQKASRAAKDTVEEECTQDNDLFNACLKMIRHATVIANRYFVKVLCDLQRPEDWGAGGREVGEVVFIESKGEKAPVLPVFSPYWIISAVYGLVNLFFKFYIKYIAVRDDGTLLLYLYKNFTAVYSHYIDRTENLFGCQQFNLEVESGRMDGNASERKFFGLDKRISAPGIAPMRCLLFLIFLIL